MVAAILLVLVPLSSFAVYHISHEIWEIHQHVEEVALSMARVNAAEIARRIAVTETFLQKLADNADLRSLDAKRCGHWFDHFNQLYPEHSNLLTKDLDGHPVCSALPVPAGTKINLANYLDEVRHNNGFAIGIPNRGALSGRWVVPLDFPIRSDAGDILGTVSAPLDLLKFNPFVGAAAFQGLPEGTTATLFAPDMTMLARSVDAEKWVGSRRLQVPELLALVAGQSETARFVSQVDHIERIHGAARVPGTAWTTLVSIPTASYDAMINQRVLQWVGIFALVLLVCLSAILLLTLKAPVPEAAAAVLAEPAAETASPQRLTNSIVFFAIVLVTLGLFGYMFRASYLNTRAEILSDTGNVAEVLAMTIGDTLARAQSDLKVFTEQLSADDLAGRASDQRRADLEARMGYHLRSFPAVFAYSVFDFQGKNLFWASPTAPRGGISVADRAWFKALRDGPGRDMVLSEVLTGKATQRQTVIMANALRDGKDRFLGVIVAAVNLEDFQRRIDLLDLGSRDLVVVRRTEDASLVLRRPQVLERLNEPSKSGLVEVFRGPDTVANGEFTSTVDQARRLFAYRRVANFPLGVVVAVSAEDHFAAWRQQTILIAAVALALLGTLMLLYRHQLAVQRQLKASEGHLAGQVAHFEALMAGASDGIHVLDRQGAVIEASDSFCRMLGYSRDEVMAMTVSQWDTQMSPEDLAQALASQIEHQGKTVFETRHRRKDGTVFPVEITGYPFVLDGRWVIFNSSRDISLRRALEDKLRQTNAELEQFAYVTSHDLRQPLRMVANYLDLIEKRIGPELGEETRKFLGFAVGGAKRMDRLILDLLEYSRTGRKTTPAAPVALAEAVAASLQTLSLAIAEADAQVSVAEGLPVIDGDVQDLTRLFQNLIGNAIKYRDPERRPTIDIGHRREGQDIVVWVADNGIGIAPADRERAFAIFQRLVARDAYEGTGIGLAICKKVVERHGGSIWIEDAPGGGCVFLMKFPG
ncbi:MAG TPA: PAS domain S-box protein [Rhodospirillaceae bacterium]|nr:PAS domain S-box protein [Rhodospirillaceae bacterium]